MIDRVRNVTTIRLDSPMATRPSLAPGNWLIVAGTVRQTVLSGVGQGTAIVFQTVSNGIVSGASPRIEYTPPPFQVVALMDASLQTPVFDFRSPIIVI